MSGEECQVCFGNKQRHLEGEDVNDDCAFWEQPAVQQEVCRASGRASLSEFVLYTSEECSQVRRTWSVGKHCAEMQEEERHVCWGLGRVAFSVALCVTLGPLYFISMPVNKSSGFFWCLSSCQCTGGYTAIGKRSGTTIREVPTAVIQWAGSSHCKYPSKESPRVWFLAEKCHLICRTDRARAIHKRFPAKWPCPLHSKKETQTIAIKCSELNKQCPAVRQSWVPFSFFLTLRRPLLAWRLSQTFQVFPNFKWKIPLNSAGNKAAQGSCPFLKEPRKQAWVTLKLEDDQKGGKTDKVSKPFGCTSASPLTALLCIPRNSCWCQQLGQQLPDSSRGVHMDHTQRHGSSRGCACRAWEWAPDVCGADRGWNPQWLKGKVMHCSSAWTATGRGKYRC